MSSGQPLHTNCRFSGQRVCRCVYGNSAILASRSDAEPAPDAAEAYMQRARAAWRLLHHPDSPALRDHEPVVLWLPRLEKRAARPATSAAVAAAAAQVRRAEAAARAAVVRAAGLAAAAGLPFRLPDQLQAQLGGSPLDLGGLVQADHSELERQVHALHHAQQAQQVAPAAGGTSLPTPNVAPLLAAAAANSSDGLLPPGSSGRPVQRSRSLDAGPVGGGPPQLAGAQSLPLPSRTASGSAGARARRSPASKPRTRTVPGTGQAGPGAGSCGSLRGTRRASSGSPRQGGAAGAGGPSLAPFGPGYKPRGASAAAPPSKWLLTMRDFTPALRGKHVQTFWPGSGRWLPAVVLAVSLPARTCTLYYETGDEQSLDFPPVVHAGEVAWLRGPPTAAVASASGGSQGASGSPLLQPGSLPPLSPGLCSPSQQSLHSTDQQQDQQCAAHEGVSPRRQRSETVPAEAAGQAAEPSGERLAGRAGSMPSDPASGRPSPAVHGPAGPTQSEEGGLRKGGDMGPDAGCRDAAELLPALGSPGEAACPGSELLVGTAELPGPLAPPPVALREHEGQGPGGVAAPADKEGAAPAEQRDDQLRQPALNGLRAQADAPPPAEQHERQPEQQDHRLLQDNCQLEPAQQPELAQHAGAAPPGCQPKQDDAVPVVEEEQPEQAAAGGADEQQAVAVPALASGIAAPLLPCASAEQREEQAALALAAAPQEAARVQEQLPPLQPPDQVQPSAVEEPGPGQQGAPDAEALGTLDQPQGARQPDVPAPQL